MRKSVYACGASGVSREFVLVGPQRGPTKVCFSTPKVGGSGGMPPQEIFEKLALMRAILVHSGRYILAHIIYKQKWIIKSILQWN